jgi:hypothetical protein
VLIWFLLGRNQSALQKIRLMVQVREHWHDFVRPVHLSRTLERDLKSALEKGSAGTASQDAQGALGGNDFKQILFRALTSGLVQEFGSGAQVERNRANVLALAPSTEFFAELTDFFPGGTK